VCALCCVCRDWLRQLAILAVCTRSVGAGYGCFFEQAYILVYTSILLHDDTYVCVCACRVCACVLMVRIYMYILVYIYMFIAMRQQHTVRAGSFALAQAGIATFTNLTLTLAGQGFTLRFHLLQRDKAPWPDVATVDSFPAFQVMPGAPYALHVDQQPAGAVTWAALEMSPLVSVHDAGGNKVPEGPSFIFAALLLPQSTNTQMNSKLYNISRPNPTPRPSTVTAPLTSPNAAAAPEWNMWIDTTNTSVLADALGTAKFRGMRIFGRATRGLVIRFQHCWKDSGSVCSRALTIDSHPFDLAALPKRLAVQASSAVNASPLASPIELTPDDWLGHPLLSLMTVSLVDANGILVQRPIFTALPEMASRVSDVGSTAQVHKPWANMTVSLCFLTDSAAQEFYCRGEPVDALLFPGGKDKDGRMQRSCALGPDIFVPKMFGVSSVPVVLGQSRMQNMRIMSSGIFKFRFRIVAPTLPNIQHVDSVSFRVVVGKVAKLLEVRAVAGLLPGHAARQQPVLAVTDSGGNHVADACDVEGRDKIAVQLMYPVQPSGAGILAQQWQLLQLSPTASLRHCVAEFVGIQVDRSGSGMRLNYSFVPYIAPIEQASGSYIAPTLEQVAATAAAAAKLAAVVNLWTLSETFHLNIGSLDVMQEVQMPVGCLAGVVCDVQPSILLLDAGGNQVREHTGWLLVASGITGSGIELTKSFRSLVDEYGRAHFTDLFVAVPSFGIRLNYTLQDLPRVGFMGREFQISGSAAALTINIQPSRASPGLVMAQQPFLLLVDAQGIRVSSHSSGAINPVPIGPGVVDGSTDTVVVEVVAYTTKTGASAEQKQLLLTGKTVVLMQRGKSEFTDLDLSFVGTCLQMSFFVHGFPSKAAADEYSNRAVQNVQSPAVFAAFLKRTFSTTSAKLEVVIGAAHHLVPLTQPSGASAGAIFGVQPQIAINDAGANLVKLDSGSPVTAFLMNGATSLLQGGAGKIVASKEGIIAFTNLRLDLASTCHVLTFKRPGVFPCSTRPLIVRPSVAYTLDLVQEPDGATPGATITTQPIVKIVDVFGNVLWDTNVQVTAVLLLNGNHLPAALGSAPFPVPYYGESRGRGLIGKVDLGIDAEQSQLEVCELKSSSCRAPKVRAIVSWTDLRLDARDKSLGYSIIFQCLSVLSVTSRTFEVLNGKALRLVVIVQPEGFRAGYSAGIHFKVQPLVALHDSGGNVIPHNISVTVQLKPVLAALGDATLILTGTYDQFSVSPLSRIHELEAATGTDQVIRAQDGGTGVVSWTDLGLKSFTSSTASGLMLEFSASCKPSATCAFLGVRSREFTSGGAPTAVALLTSPLTASIAGSVLPVQPKVLVQDLSRVTVEYWDGASSDYAVAIVELSTMAGADGRKAVLLGNTSATYRLGIAQFTDLRIDVTSGAPESTSSVTTPGYFLTFRLRGREWTEGGLAVTHAEPDRYLIWVQPGSGQGGAALVALAAAANTLHPGGGPVIVVVDRYGNRAESITGGVVTATLINISAIAFSVHPGEVQAVGTLEIPLQRGLANFSTSGLGSKVAAAHLQFNFSGRGVAAVPGVSAGWTFPTTDTSPSTLVSPTLEARWVVSHPFTVTQGAVVRLSAYVEPNVFVSSNLLNIQPVILLLDAGSNAVSEASWQTISVALLTSDGTQTTLGSVVASNGVAVFKTIGMPASPAAAAHFEYRCDPCEFGHTAITLRSSSFDVAEFSGGKSVSIATAISPDIYGGAVFAQQPVVSVQDSQGRRVTADSSTVVRATAITQTPPNVLWDIPSNILMGATEATAVRGVAMFTDLRITWCNHAGSRPCTTSPYAKVHIRFSTQSLSPMCAPFPERYPPFSPPCVPADSAALTVQVGSAAALTLLQQPSGGSPGVAFVNSPIVVVADAGGNLVDDTPASLVGMTVAVELVNVVTEMVVSKLLLVGRTSIRCDDFLLVRVCVCMHSRSR